MDSDFPITILPREPSREIMSNGHQPETPDSEDGDTGFFMQPSVVALQEMALKVKTPPLMDDMAIESPECVLIVNPEVLFETDVLKSEDDVQDVASPPTTTVLKSSTLPSHEPRALHDVEGAPTLGNHLGLLPNDSLENSSKASSLEVQPPTSYRSDKVTVLSDPLFDQRVDRDTSQPSDLSLSEAETRLTIMRQFLSMEDHDSSLLDMKVSIQNRVFSTHRLLMAMYSQLFLDMYNDGRLKPFCTVVIEDISPEGFNCVLHWINTSILDLKMASVDEVLEVARFLGIKTLIDKLDCLKASSSLSDQDVILLYEHAIRHGLQDLSVEFGRKAAAAFQEILHSKRHLHYTKDQLCLLLSRDDLKIFKESDVFSAACEWLLYAWDARQEWEGQVMSCVRFKLMSPCEMNDLLLDVQNPLTRSYQVVVMMMHALLYRALKAESGVIPLFLGSDQPARTAIEMASSQRLTESVHQQQSPLCAKSPPPLPPTRFLKPLNPHAAATRIQAQYRGHLTRRAMQELEQSAQTIQRVYRGHVVRKELRTLNNASIVVQGAFRRYLSHKRYDLLTAAASNVNAARQSMAASIAVKPRDQPWFRLPVMAAFMCFGGVTNESDGDDVNNIIEIGKCERVWCVCGAPL